MAAMLVRDMLVRASIDHMPQVSSHVTVSSKGADGAGAVETDQAGAAKPDQADALIEDPYISPVHVILQDAGSAALGSIR